MGLLTEFVELKLSPPYINHFKKLGYDMPMNDYGNGEYHVDISKSITVNVHDLPKGSGVLVDVKCDNPKCENVHKVRYYNYLKMMNKYNGVYCRECIMSLFITGENHGSWDQMRTDYDRRVKRDGRDYKHFIQNVLERDNHTCQCCGSKTNTVVHHLNGYTWCVEGRTDEDNGITLCNTCHLDFHTKYGFKSNTKEQFIEWISQVDKKALYEKSIGQELRTKREKLPKKPPRKLYCLEEDKVYDSVDDYKTQHNLSKYDSSVTKACNNRKETKEGLHLYWYDEYINMTEEEISFYINK